MSAVTLARREGKAGILILLVLTAVLLAPICFLGYGSWLNIYMMLSAAKSTWLDHVPSTSRPPGFLAYEAVLFATSEVGGYVLTNLVNLAVSLIDIALVYVLALRRRAAYPVLCAAIVAVHPIFVVEATSSQDFNLALMCVLLGVLALDARRIWIATLLLALACYVRLSTIVPVGAVYAAFVLVHLRQRDRLIQDVSSGLAVLALFLLGCVPSYLLLGPEFYRGNLGPDEMWSATAWIGRFFYKALYFFGGPLAAIGALAVIALSFAGRRRADGSAATARPASASGAGDWPGRYREIILVWLPLAGGVLLFAKYPIRLSYLIVTLPFFALALDQVAARIGRPLMLVFILAIASQNVAVLTLAKPDIPGASTGGRFAPSVDPGFVLADIAERRRFIGCDTLDCFIERSGQQGVYRPPGR